jgi:hypothetical protein
MPVAGKTEETSAIVDRWMSLYEAADVLGESRHAVMQRIIRQELEASVVAGRTVVSRESVRRVLAART